MKSSKHFKLAVIALAFTGAVWAKPARTAPVILATSYAVMDLSNGEMLKEHNSQEVRSIASITKMMTALVVLDSQQNLYEKIAVEPMPGISTKLRKGIDVDRGFLLHVGLMSSDNLAMKLLAKNYPGGEEAFVEQMNAKARSLGMVNTTFTDPTGLLDTNVSTAQDLIKLLVYADSYNVIREYSTSENAKLEVPGKKKSSIVYFNTTNSLVKKYKNIVISKTGWIRKSGGCLVMLVQDHLSKRAIVVLNSRNTRTRIVDGDLLYGIHNNGKNI